MFCVGVIVRCQKRYRKDATYHRFARGLEHPAVERADLADKYCSLQLGKDVAVAKDY